MSRATRALALAGIAASVLTGVSCGGDGSSGAPIGGVRPAVAQLQQAFAEEDASALCARMTRAAMRQAGSE